MKEVPMGLGDKAKNAAQDALGKAKEAVGEVKDDDKLKAEGKADQAEAKVKKTGEDVKDVFKG
jgi:uncharacterized protein YjbJ (UPF0337 family)